MQRFYFLIISSLFIMCHHKPLESFTSKIPSIEEIDYTMDTLHCKDKPLPPLIGPNQGRIMNIVLPQIQTFCVNPNNSDEIVYTQIGGPQIMQLFHFNRSTQMRRLLYDGYLFETPRWHRNHWIVFVTHNLAGDKLLYKINPISGNIQHFITYETETGVTWNHDGTKLALYPRNKRGLLYVLSAQTGNLLDSITVQSAFYSFFDWIKPDVFASQQSDGSIIAYDMLDQSQSLVVEGQGSPYGFSWWFDFKKMVFATKTGLFITNIETRQIKKIKCACSTLAYKCPVFDASGTKIFAIKEEKYWFEPIVNNTPIYFSTKLVQMNVDGSNEQIIDLPQ